MILFSPGSHLATLITILSLAGEFPTQSLFLLGNERSYKRLVHMLTEQQVFRNSITGEKLQVKLLSISGNSQNKTLRFTKAGLPLLDWAGVRENYLSRFSSYTFSGNRQHVERNHRKAEAIAMAMRAGMEYRPSMLPQLQPSYSKGNIQKTSFYSSLDIKNVREAEMKKTMYTRLTGAVFSPGFCYPVYNTRGSVMKWFGMGEYKAQVRLLELGRLNADVKRVDSAILLGKSYEVAIRTLAESEKSPEYEFRFDSIYQHIFFIPMTEFGIRQFQLIRRPDWREQLLDILFEPETRSYDRGSFEYDAYVDGVHVFSFLDGDMARLLRFKGAAGDHRRKYDVLCYPEQLPFLRGYLDGHIHFSTVGIDQVEQQLIL